MSSSVHDLHRLAQIDRLISERGVSIRTGKSFSTTDTEMDARIRRVFPRQDQVSREATSLVLMFLRQLFSEHSSYRWKAGDRGETHPDADIVIESVFGAGPAQDPDLARPLLRVRPGPRSSQSLSAGDIKHHDFLSGAVTMTYLDIGTMQILVHAKEGAVAQDLVEFVCRALKMPMNPLLCRAFVGIENVTGAGYDDDNPTYNRGTAAKTHVVLPITFTYYWQSTMRSEIRQGQYEYARVAGVRSLRRDGPREEPFVDGLADSVVQSDAVTYLLPLDPDED